MSSDFAILPCVNLEESWARPSWNSANFVQSIHSYVQHFAECSPATCTLGKSLSRFIPPTITSLANPKPRLDLFRYRTLFNSGSLQCMDTGMWRDDLCCQSDSGQEKGERSPRITISISRQRQISTSPHTRHACTRRRRNRKYSGGKDRQSNNNSYSTIVVHSLSLIAFSLVWSGWQLPETNLPTSSSLFQASDGSYEMMNQDHFCHDIENGRCSCSRYLCRWALWRWPWPLA